MKRTAFLKLLAALIIASMMISLISCNSDPVESDTESTDAETESTEAVGSEDVSVSETEGVHATESESETESVTDSVSTTEVESEIISETASESKDETVSETETESGSQHESESKTETENDTETETETESETVTETETDTETDTETESETVTETETDTETDTETESETVTETETDTETDMETESETVTESETENKTETESETVTEIETESETEEVLDIGTYENYDLESYMVPYWEGNVVYNETVMFVGINDKAPLLYDAKKIISVRSYDLKTEYVEGVDYDYVDGKLVLLEGTSIPYIPEDVYYKDGGSGIKLFTVMPDGTKKPTMVSSGTVMAQYQVAVTYTHADEWSGYKVPDMSDRFADFIAKLEAGEDVTIIFCGDSITTGAEASGYHGMYPHMPSWPQLFTRYLAACYGYSVEGVETKNTLDNPHIVKTMADCCYGKNGTITYINSAVGGWLAEQGRDNVDAYINDFAEKYGCDLLILGFGMNNGSSSADFIKDVLRETVLATRESAPNADVLLISTMLPNIHVEVAAGYHVATQHTFEPAMLALADELNSDGINCAVAPMTSVSRSILEIKRYRDTNANNINHPNDFMARAYAHTLIQTIFGSDTLAEKEIAEELPDNTREITSRELAMAAGVYYMVKPSYEPFDGVPYARFTSATTDAAPTAQIIFTRYRLPNGDMGPDKPFDIGQAKYIVLKMRCNAPEQLCHLYFGTEEVSNATSKVGFSLDDEWVTYVVDMESAFGSAYEIGDNGRYEVLTLYFHLTNMSLGRTLDVQYINFCDDWKEITEIVDQDEVKFIKNTSSVQTLTKTGECTGDHSVDERVEDGVLVWACDACGAEIGQKQIPEAANVYVSAVAITNISGSVNKTTFVNKDGGFARIYGGASYTAFKLYSNSAGDYATGAFLVIKYRIANNGGNQQQIILYAGTESTSATNERQSIKLMPEVIEDEEFVWRTAVIDMSQAIGITADGSEYIKNGDGEYCAKFVQFHPFTTASNVNSDFYMDLAFAAMCDTYEEAVSMVDTETFDHYTTSTRPTVVETNN